MSLTLVIGTKTYSSWSMRPWFALVEAGIPFEEVLIPLYQSSTPQDIRKVSPTGKVPLLKDNGILHWESLSILEHIAEQNPGAKLWPDGPAARAHARSAATEMHGGFIELRKHLPMNFRRIPRPRPTMPDAVKADVARIVQLWGEAREGFGASGPWLYGRFSIADAMYAPVVHRLHAYAVPVPPVAQAYMSAVMASATWKRWEKEAAAEPQSYIHPGYDAD